MENDKYIQVQDNKYKVPYTRANGKKANRYFMKVQCSVCKCDMFQHLSNFKSNTNAVCSSKCVSELKSVADGTTKRKRVKTHKSNAVLIKAVNHPQAKKGWILEHRLVMETLLGRFLLESEVIHHINMVDNDNKEDNLYLCKSTSEHNEVHASLNLCVKQLMDENKLGFHEGKYYVK